MKELGMVCDFNFKNHELYLHDGTVLKLPPNQDSSKKLGEYINGLNNHNERAVRKLFLDVFGVPIESLNPEFKKDVSAIAAA